MNQTPEELARFIGFMASHEVESYLEIGCRWGDTLYAVGMSLPAGARVVGVDLPGIKTGGVPYKAQGSQPYLQSAVEALRTAGRDAHLVIGNSRDPDTIAAARALGPFGMVLIDGDHTPEGVLADWKNYGPMGRMVAFHDIRNRQASWGVRALFEEVSQGRKAKAISASGERRGIGILWN